MTTQNNKMSPGAMIIVAIVVIGAIFIGWSMATSDDSGDGRLTRAAQELTQDEEMSIEAGDFEARITD